MTLAERIEADKPATPFQSGQSTHSPLGLPPKRRYGGGLKYKLWQIGLPLTDAAFGILRGPEDLATLISLRGTGQPSKAAREQVNGFLKRRARKAVMDLKHWLGLKPGRPRDISKEQVWATGAALRRDNPQLWSWRKITQKLDPSGYADDHQRATDRMRMGIQDWENRQARKNKSRL